MIKKHIREFRKKFLDPITEHINQYNLMEINERILEKFKTKGKFINYLPNEKIDSINENLKFDKHTIKDQYSYFSGSNISGAEKNPKASPLICLEQAYFKCNFLNPIKKITTNSKNFTNKYFIKETVSLQTFIDNNYSQEFNEWFKKFNKEYYDNINENIILDKNNYVDIFNYAKDYIKTYLEGGFGCSDPESHKKMLRNLYRSSIKKEMEAGKIPSNSTNEDYNLRVIQNAHIIKFSTLVEENTQDSLELAINPFNVLKINSDNHILFDNHYITFDSQGNMLNKQNKTVYKNYLNLETLPPESKKILEDNYNFWKENQQNK